MINTAERGMRINRGEVREARGTPGWERLRVQIDSGAIDTVGPKEIARALEMKETAVSRRHFGIVAASGGGIISYGEEHHQTHGR